VDGRAGPQGADPARARRAGAVLPHRRGGDAARRRELLRRAIRPAALGRGEARPRRVPANALAAPRSAHVAGVAQGVAPGLRPYRETVRLLADRNRDHLARGGVDHVDDVIVAAREPQVLTVGADVAHVGTAAPRDGPRRHDLARREVDDRDAPRAARLAADLRRAAVGHVELRSIAAGIEPVGADARLDEADLLEGVAVDHIDAAALELGHVENLAVGADADILRNAAAGQLEVAQHLAVDPVDFHEAALILAGH